jgi:YaiO family outer membrane protein
MKPTARLSALLLALCAGTAAAQQAPSPTDRVALEAETSHLDRGLGNWQQQTLRVGRQWGRRTSVDAEASHVHRFGLHDQEFAVAGTLPLGEPLTLSLRASHSPTHRVIARASAQAALQWEFRKAWLAHGALKRTRYDAVDVTLASGMLEHYFGDFSALVAVHNARAFGDDQQSLELRGTYHYAEGSSAGFILAGGDEATAVAPGRVVIAQVRSVALLGRHALGPRWGVRWNLHRVKQGSFHTRQGAGVGVEYAF